MISTSECSGAEKVPWWAETLSASKEEFTLRLEGEIRESLRGLAMKIALTDEFIPNYVLAFHKIDRTSIVADVLEKLAKEFRHDD